LYRLSALFLPPPPASKLHTLSLHDALPISPSEGQAGERPGRGPHARLPPVRDPQSRRRCGDAPPEGRGPRDLRDDRGHPDRAAEGRGGGAVRSRRSSRRGHGEGVRGGAGPGRLGGHQRAPVPELGSLGGLHRRRLRRSRGMTMSTTNLSPPPTAPGARATSTPARGSRARGTDLMWIYLFIVPGLVLTSLFIFYPMGASWYFSLTEWNGFSDAKSFVGLENSRELVEDGLFWGAFGRSMIFVLVGVPLRVVLALILAIVLNNVIRGRLSTFFRTVFFLPVMAAASVIGVVLTFVLSPSNGPVALFLEGTGISDAQVEFLSDPAIALWSALLLHTWKNFGMTLIYWLAALQTVPAEYYEAAEVDGAGAVQRLMKVT